METSNHTIVGTAPPLPKDMSHHYSDVTKARAPSRMKEFYKYFLIPNIGQLAGGTKRLSSSYLVNIRADL